MFNIYIVFPTASFIILSLIGLIFYFIKNPEKVDYWSYVYYKYAFWKGENREKKIVSSDLDHRITKYAKKINDESEGILPYGIRIKWKATDEINTYIEKKDVVVVLRKEDNLDKNIVQACMAYVPKAILPKSRNSVKNRILDSIDIYTIKKILEQGKFESAYNHFMQKIHDPLIFQKNDIKKYTKDISNIDEIGFFTRVLLSEYKLLGNKLFGTTEEKEFLTETLNFFQFLTEFYKREPGDDSTKLYFNGDKIKIAILLIAKKYSLNRYGIDFYVNKMIRFRNYGIKNIYLFSYSEKEMELIMDESGKPTGTMTKKNYDSLNQIKKKLKGSYDFDLEKEEEYYTKDVTGKFRDAKYLIYSSIGN